MRDYAGIWQAAEKIVYSRTLERASSAKTRIERAFDPEAVRQMKEAARRDIAVRGSGARRPAIQAGLVDECHLFLDPVVVGGGTRSVPRDVRVRLDLLDERRFGKGSPPPLPHRTLRRHLPVAAGHEVVGMTRSESKQAALHELGANPEVADALDADQVPDAVGGARPDAIVHQLTAIAALDLRHFDRDFAPQSSPG